VLSRLQNKFKSRKNKDFQRWIYQKHKQRQLSKKIKLKFENLINHSLTESEIMGVETQSSLELRLSDICRIIFNKLTVILESGSVKSFRALHLNVTVGFVCVWWRYIKIKNPIYKRLLTGCLVGLHKRL